jgi:hypothetical protein
MGMEVRMPVFRVAYDEKWSDGDFETISSIPATASTVAAEDAEQAIARVRKHAVGAKLPKVNDKGEELRGKYVRCEAIRVHTVEYVSNLDIN